MAQQILKGIKQISLSAYKLLSDSEKNACLWFVRDDRVTTGDSAIYFGNKKYSDTNNIYQAATVDEAQTYSKNNPDVFVFVEKVNDDDIINRAVAQALTETFKQTRFLEAVDDNSQVNVVVDEEAKTVTFGFDVDSTLNAGTY